MSLLPLVKKKDIAAILSPFLTDYQFATEFKPIPVRAKSRYIFRSCIFSIPIVAASFIFFKAWGFLSLVLLVLCAFWALLKYKDGGWVVEQQQLTLRYRTIGRTTVFMKKDKIQSLDMKDSIFQRRKRLASVEAFVKAGFGGSGGLKRSNERVDCVPVQR